ncbi:hypothetical protein L1049_022785 [Liquidambar formosana]|uniref:Reverse transcriptase zinc-binding domain-containing protein n=1 Tax=Liquidambar formosana TaxID=63359 RepID=A0AAP0RF29_LIQFO
MPLDQRLNLSQATSDTLNFSVSKMADGVFLSEFSSFISEIAEETILIHLPVKNIDDHIIWSPSCHGHLSFSEAYSFCRSTKPEVGWAYQLWKPFISPRFSIFVWRLLRNMTSTEDQLQKLLCCLCSQLSNLEDAAHLFLNHSFAGGPLVMFLISDHSIISQ